MSAHDELLKIHTILMAPGDCPEISDGDTLTVRMLKAVIHDWHKQQRIVAAMSADRFGPPGRGARGLGPPPTTPQVAAMQQSQQGEIVAGKPETPNDPGAERGQKRRNNMDHLIDDSDRLKPCQFCGAEAEMVTLEGETDGPSIGAQCVQCTSSACGAASGLIYPLMDDVTDLLRERWNKRHNG